MHKILRCFYNLLNKIGASECIRCGRYGTVLCQDCMNDSVTFALPTNLLGTDTVTVSSFKADMMLFRKAPLDNTYHYAFEAQSAHAGASRIVFRLAHLYSLFNYNNIVREVVRLYKGNLIFSIGIDLFRTLSNWYKYTDPFSLVYNLNNLYHYLMSKYALPLLVFYPGSVRINKRGFDHVRLVVRSLFIDSLSFRIIRIPVYSRKKVKMAMLDRLSRLSTEHSWEVSSKVSLQITGYFESLVCRVAKASENRCIPIVIFDDIVTTGSTMRSLVVYVMKLLTNYVLPNNIVYNLCIIPISFFRTMRYKS